MPEPIQPVLAPEEWADTPEVLANELTGYAYLDAAGVLNIDGGLDAEDRLKLAVRWLHEAGWFTREMVEQVREAAQDQHFHHVRDNAAALREIADRLAAILPPREPVKNRGYTGGYSGHSDTESPGGPNL